MVYFERWSDSGLEGMMHDFKIEKSDLVGVKILYASYHDFGYDGAAFVLFRKDGKLYEVFGSHCSCFGLEGQWEPNETSLDFLRKVFAQENPYAPYSYHVQDFTPILSKLRNSRKTN